MERSNETSITIGVLGVVITMIGLFPGLVGLETVPGIGVLQVIVILGGFSLLFLGAYIFVHQSFYRGTRRTLAQDVGIRLTMTGLVIAAAGGLADVLGFGSHPPTPDTRPLLGALQATVFVGGFLVASSGVVFYALFGPRAEPDEDADEEEDGV
ncbi:MAG: hypothetical protein GX613_11980 [Chloroflexi bacterium]|nr:hypothetical protein [Chloroflexota bacterium]